jgi:hypothetical protein
VSHLNSSSGFVRVAENKILCALQRTQERVTDLQKEEGTISGLRQFFSWMYGPLINGEPADELSFVRAYMDLTGANEFAARGVFMYRGCQEAIEMHPDYADVDGPYSAGQSSNHSTQDFEMQLAY